MTTDATDARLTRLSLEIDGAAANIALQNAPLNVIDIRMMEELALVLGELEAQPKVMALVLIGDGRAFSAGVDIAAHTPDKVEEMLSKFHGVIRSLVATRKVTIASVHGLCLGGGAELAMMCDLVYTSEDAEWGFPEIKLGCYPPVACTALAALVGQKRATELIVTGDTFTGRDAAQMGLASATGTRKELEQKATELLAKLGKLSAA